MKLNKGMAALITMVALVTAFALIACDGNGTEPAMVDSALLSVTPQGGATGIDPNAPIVIQFNHAMMEGMEAYADVHEGHIEGTLVPGSWSWNGNRTQLTFTPDAPLKPQTTYVIHIGGGMQDGEGHHINFEEHGFGMGGQWMTQQMHQDGQHGYGMGTGGMGGMGGGSGMGQGWVHPTNGGYGMIFTFTTA
jgi:hypothetical protein